MYGIYGYFDNELVRTWRGTYKEALQCAVVTETIVCKMVIVKELK